MDSQKRIRSIEWLQIGATIGSLVVAVVALIVTFNTEQRSAERFHQQLAQSNQIAKANIRPLLSIGSSGFIGIKGFILKNDGLGTAVIKKILFKKNNRSASNLAELFKFKERVIWNNFYVFPKSDFFLPEGEEITLLYLTAEKLKDQGYNESEIQHIMKEFSIQQKNIEIHIEYEDLLGNLQDAIQIAF